MTVADPASVLQGLVLIATATVLVRESSGFDAVLHALYTDNRCQRCGYRNNHPFVVHGPDRCEAR